MVTSNIRTDDGLVNGSIGILKEIDFAGSCDGIKCPCKLWFEFENPNVGKKTRQEDSHRYFANLTPITKSKRNFVYQFRNRYDCCQQFPIVPAEAITIHKSQGGTYNQVAVHTNKRFTRELMYVACSRSTSASGLYIIGHFQKTKPFSKNSILMNEILKLKTEKKTCHQHRHVFAAGSF